ncbi:hypothetical protein AncyloWKF20_20770 [Ancylobacter sp. WKF20]|uniref:hypothetical protein n=1 Tax=Ancylobacter sp. WKF20 TaxID=3039801 RepID=UPI0024344B9A|nr:hypothetical protein [Ancylobacter sp. WKF20]WGD30152.1 hypothetical protein AncyloWKF20_20770 [Ancylobacter sp. WKF20]
MSPPDDAERAARLAAALRENLKRRKAQSKGRAASPGADAAPGEGAAEPVLAGEGEAPPSATAVSPAKIGG